jgi:hypothetical protein
MNDGSGWKKSLQCLLMCLYVERLTDRRARERESEWGRDLYETLRRRRAGYPQTNK